MNKNTKNSLIFGAIVGGLSAFIRGKGNKQKLTDNQLKVINDTGDSFTKLQSSLLEHIDFINIYKFIEEKTPSKNYVAIINLINDEIVISNKNISLANVLKINIQNILDNSFILEKDNSKARESQILFSKYKEAPEQIESLLQVRIKLLDLMKNTYTRIKNGEVTDFTPEDTELLKSLMDEFKSLLQKVTDSLSGFKL